jgi:MFS family permease
MLCAIAPTLPFLILARLIQGVGAGILGPVAIALISTLFPTETRGKAMGLFAAIQLLANLVGPVAGGFVSASLGWPYAFYMILPFGILSLLFIPFAPLGKNTIRPSALTSIDYGGALLLGAAIASFVQAWTWVEVSGWNGIVAAFLIGSAFLFTLFLFQEQNHPDPIVPPRLVQIKNVTVSIWSALLTGLLMYGAIAIFPLYAMFVFKNDATQSSAFLLPLMVGISMGILISGHRMQQLLYRTLAKTGWLITALGLACMSLVSLTPLPLTVQYGWAGLIGFGIGILVPTFLLPAQQAVSESNQATIGGIIQLSRNVGGAAGIPILTVILNLPVGSDANRYGLLFFSLFMLSILGYLIGSKLEGRPVQANGRSENER